MKLCGREIGGPADELFFIAGPCVIESEALAMEAAERIARIRDRLGCMVIYKSSFDKANRSSAASFRGLGMDEGLRILEKVRDHFGLPILTDVHEKDQVAAVAQVVDVLQTPAFLARQTDFVQAVAGSGKPVNIKKAQFMAPADMRNVVMKAEAVGGHVMACERGATFGYHNLVVDMRGLATMREFAPVVFDATHSVQLPGGQGTSSGGEREFVPILARAAVAVGIAGVFMETHPRPDEAMCDGPNAWPLDQLEHLMISLLEIDGLVKSLPIKH
jgi:2-dehydro-3-deoxyphosphooctonate aldolase (KDO 8-P synthase)